MADFKTHVTASSIVGIGYGGAAYALGGIPLPDCLLAATFCSVAGMLPDIDSGPGRPLREITTFLAVMVPTMFLSRLYESGISQSWRILIVIALYSAIRYGLRNALKRYTVHRGMFHSLAAAAIFGELAFLLMYGEERLIRWFVAAAVVLGFLSHLLLDELYSVQWDGRPRLKSSFGTAVKLFGKGWWPNISVYGKLALLTAVVVFDPAIVRRIRDGEVRDNVHQIAGELREQIRAREVSPQDTGRPALFSVFAVPAPRAVSPADTGGPETAEVGTPWQPAAGGYGGAPYSQPDYGYERTATRPTYPEATYPAGPLPANQPSPPLYQPPVSPTDHWRYAAPPPTTNDGFYRR